MYGGTISNNRVGRDADNFIPDTRGHGGGVYARGIFNFNGGTITGNDAYRTGGGVHISVATSAEFNQARGTTINGNTAAHGGGVSWFNGEWNQVGNAGNLNIAGNTARASGGGVYVRGLWGTTERALPTNLAIGGNHAPNGGGLALSQATLRMDAGTIIGGTDASRAVTGRNQAMGTGNNGFGGGMLITGGTFNMTGGTVGRATAPGDASPGNIASTAGGGIAANGAVNLTVSGGHIRGNFAGAIGVLENQDGDGGGVHFDSTGTFTLSSGTIQENRARYGGGVWVNNGIGLGGNRFNMTAATISANHAYHDGGGIFASAFTYLNPLPTGAYPRMVVSTEANFSANTAGNGASTPPINATTTTAITNAASRSGDFVHPLNNLDINYRLPRRQQIVTFDTQGGIWPVIGGTANQTRTINRGMEEDTYAQAFDTNGNLVNGPQDHPTRVGYVFGGWWSAPTGGNQVLYSHAVSDAANRTLYARWTPQMRDVTYVVTGIAPTPVAEMPAEISSHQWNTSVTRAAAPTTTSTTHNGVTGTWRFDGWTTTSPGVTITPSPGVGGTFTMPNNNVAFTGTWTFTPTNFNVTYTIDGIAPTSVAGMPPANIHAAGSNVTRAAAPTTTSLGPNGEAGTWTFLGWTDEYETPVLTPGVGGTFTMPNRDVEFVGRWTFTAMDLPTIVKSANSG